MAKEDPFTEKEAIELLKKYSNENETSFSIVKEHSLSVKREALKLCKQLKPGIKINQHLVVLGALLHDIGRFDYPPKKKDSIRHGIHGAEILRKEGLFLCADIAEKHVGIGIKKTDIMKQKLRLPLKDYVPETDEEKIVCYADKLIAGTKVMDEEWVIEQYGSELGQEMEKRAIEFFKEINSMRMVL